MNNFNLLARDKTYLELAKPFFVPYGLYIGLGMLTEFGIADWQVQAAKLVAVTLSLIMFRESYSFGEFRFKHILISLVFTPAALCVWIYPLRFFTSLDSAVVEPVTLQSLVDPELYFYLRLINSVFLVALFEELLCRVFLLEFLFQAGKNQHIASFIDRLLSPLDLKPNGLVQLPFSVYSIVGSTVFFTLGHGVTSYVSAILYFSLTNILYWRTRSLWPCILVHALTNGAIAVLVRYNDMNLLWF